MDPLSASASLVGLITAAVQVTKLLNSLVQDARDAPDSARSVLREVSSISMCLQQLQGFLIGAQEAPRSRTSMILVEQALVVLSDCVLTFSDLEQSLEPLKMESSMGILDRLKWMAKEAVVSKILTQLQASKASLNLMLTTLTCASVDEANTSVRRLTDVVHQVLESNQEMSRRLKALEASSNLAEDTSSETVTLVSDSNPSASQGQDTALEFEEDLRSSRVYGRMAAKNKRVSVASSNFSKGWSFLSTASLSDVSNISVLSLPISAKGLWNHHRYSHVGVIDGIDSALLHPWYNPPANRSAFIRSTPKDPKGKITHLYDQFNLAGHPLYTKAAVCNVPPVPGWDAVSFRRYWTEFRSHIEPSNVAKKA